MTVLRFPARRSAAIWISRDNAGAWLTLCGEHGWISGSSAEAQVEAEWLASNSGLPIREITARAS